MSKEIRGWVVKSGKAYESSSDGDLCDRGWCCLRRHARVHTTLDSAIHARDGYVVEILSIANKAIPTFLPRRETIMEAIRKALLANHKVFRLVVSDGAGS